MSSFRENLEAIERLSRHAVVLPPGIGPHDGKELNLMLAGRKPLAMFCDTLPEIGAIPRHEFEPHVEAGRIVSREMTFPPKSHDDIPIRFAFYAQPWTVAGMAELREIHRRIHEGSLPNSDNVDARVGRLLGYTEQDIDAYLRWKNCILRYVLQ